MGGQSDLGCGSLDEFALHAVFIKTLGPIPSPRSFTKNWGAPPAGGLPAGYPSRPGQRTIDPRRREKSPTKCQDRNRHEPPPVPRSMLKSHVVATSWEFGLEGLSARERPEDDGKAVLRFAGGNRTIHRTNSAVAYADPTIPVPRKMAPERLRNLNLDLLQNIWISARPIVL